MEEKKGLNVETVTLGQAKQMIKALSTEQSLLLLSPPGLGKSATVEQAAREMGLPIRSLLGTQIAPEDVSGIPKIVAERSVFCPPRILLPPDNKPFFLFLDELPATSPDVQKAFYSLILDRRIGEFPLPKGTAVMAAGNRIQDRALVRNMSSALLNRLIVLNVRVDANEWLQWARQNAIRKEIIAFIQFMPVALLRRVPTSQQPFSTPRSWTMFSRALDRVEQAGGLTRKTVKALAFGSLSPEDAGLFSAYLEEDFDDLHPIVEYIKDPEKLPKEDVALWFVLSQIRGLVQRDELQECTPRQVNGFLAELTEEHRLCLLSELVGKWAEIGAHDSIIQTFNDFWEDIC